MLRLGSEFPTGAWRLWESMPEQSVALLSSQRVALFSIPALVGQFLFERLL